MVATFQLMAQQHDWVGKNVVGWLCPKSLLAVGHLAFNVR